MKNLVGIISFIFFVCFSFPAMTTEPVKVDVLFMNHGPLRKTLNDIRTVFAKHEGKITVAWHDFDSSEGTDFMKTKGISGHFPLIIWINGKNIQHINGKDISFTGFPSGAGPAMFQGTWDMSKLDAALEQATR